MEMLRYRGLGLGTMRCVRRNNTAKTVVCSRNMGYNICKPLEEVIIIIIILLKQDYKIQFANHKIQMAWLTSWLVVG